MPFVIHHYNGNGQFNEVAGDMIQNGTVFNNDSRYSYNTTTTNTAHSGNTTVYSQDTTPQSVCSEHHNDIADNLNSNTATTSGKRAARAVPQGKMNPPQLDGTRLSAQAISDRAPAPCPSFDKGHVIPSPSAKRSSLDHSFPGSVSGYQASHKVPVLVPRSKLRGTSPNYRRGLDAKTKRRRRDRNKLSTSYAIKSQESVQKKRARISHV